MTLVDTSGNGGIKLADPDAISPPPSDPLLAIYGALPSGTADVVIALLGGAVIGITGFVTIKMLGHKTRVKV
jgi:hypothetical protein